MNEMFSTTRRLCLISAATVMAFALTQGAFAAEDKFPSKPIETLIHAGAGGGTDVAVRMALLKARKYFGVNMPINYKKGGGGAVAYKYMNRRPRDGYTIKALTPTDLMTIIAGKTAIKIDDLVGLARATDEPQWIYAKTGRFADAKAMLAEGSATPLRFGGTHVGSLDHVAAAVFAKKAGIMYKYIPYEGGGHIMTNVIGGDIDIALGNLSEIDQQIEAGEVVPLMVLSKKRMKAFPDYPSAGELGVEAYFSVVRGFVTLKGLPKEREDALAEGLLKSMQDGVYQGYLKQIGLDSDSVAGAEEWNAQLQSLYKDSFEALSELGFVKK